MKKGKHMRRVCALVMAAFMAAGLAHGEMALEGVWAAEKATTRYNPASNKHERVVRHSYYIFDRLAGVYWGLPDVTALSAFSPSVFCEGRADPACGIYSVDGDSLRLTWQGLATSTKSFLPGDTAITIDGLLYRRVKAEPGLRLTGRFASPGYTGALQTGVARISFQANGEYLIEGLPAFLGTPATAQAGSRSAGRYEVGALTLTLRPATGPVMRFTFFRWPGAEASVLIIGQTAYTAITD